MYEYIIKAAAAVVLEELMLKSGIVEKIFQIGSSSLFIFQMMVEMCECRKILPNWENWGRFSLIGKMMKEMCICRKILPNLEELTNLRNLEDVNSSKFGRFENSSKFGRYDNSLKFGRSLANFSKLKNFG